MDINLGGVLREAYFTFSNYNKKIMQKLFTLMFFQLYFITYIFQQNYELKKLILSQNL